MSEEDRQVKTAEERELAYIAIVHWLMELSRQACGSTSGLSPMNPVSIRKAAQERFRALAQAVEVLDSFPDLTDCPIPAEYRM